MQKGFLLWGAMAFGVCVGSAFATDKGVYGDDDRHDVYKSENSRLMKRLARSTAALVDERTLDQQNELFVELTARTYGEKEQLCEDERFYHQPAAADCSSFLVAPDLLLSAGHCFEDFMSCDTTRVVFDYSYLSKTDDPTFIAVDNVYRCKEIVALEVNDTTGIDYAILRLDREVNGRDPLEINSAPHIEEGTNVTAIGHPSGLPTKIAGGAKVRDASNHIWFLANLDTFHVSSGSAVLNDETGAVEGILVRGDIDFKYDSEHGCRRVRTCPDDDCQGEAVTRISAFYDELSKHL